MQVNKPNLILHVFCLLTMLGHLSILSGCTDQEDSDYQINATVVTEKKQDENQNREVYKQEIEP